MQLWHHTSKYHQPSRPPLKGKLGGLTPWAALLGAMLFAFPSCGQQTVSCLTVTPPDITLTGPKTSVERQIMGNYREIEKDAWLMASAKGAGQSGVVGAGDGGQQNEIRMFRAFSIMEKYRPKLTDYQSKGIIGENNRGYLEKVSEALDKEEEARRDITMVINEVNRARESMYEILLQDLQGSEMNMERVGKRFARKYREAAPAGSKVQLANGSWVTKK